MPYKIQADGQGTYRVVNTESGAVKGSGMSRASAEAQLTLLNAEEHAEPKTRWGPGMAEHHDSVPGAELR